ncbi:MAG: FAD-dependent oxidoreductase, partial [Oscillospiraceae bacterium]|nr:FAD-dependent oxidoreductase [Oscillospiraceae bacterium]
RCEDRCTRGTVDEAVSIDEIKKFLCQYERKNLDRFVLKCENMEGKQWDDCKIAVIGAGPAGLSAAYYLRLDGYPVTVFDREKRPGGMMMNGIPNFRLEKKVIEGEIEIIRKMGVELRCGVDVGRDVTLDELRAQGYKAFFLATGLPSGGRLGVPGEDARGVIAGIDFARKVNQDPSFRLEGNVVVIGGGNIGADIARTAVRAGAAKVDLYCLESYDEMPMGPDDRREVEEDGITIHAGWGQTEILSENGACTGIRFRKCVSVRNAEGRFDPKFDDAVTEEATCTTVLYCIGQRPDFGKMLEGTKVEFNRNGTVKADPVTLQTGEPDIFVGGDVYTGQKFVIDAIAVGREGAVSINRFVHPGQSLTIGRDLRTFIELDRDDIRVESYDNAQRQMPGMKPGEATATFEDLRLALTEEQVKIEANRCLKCGATTVDLNQCIGCGLCTTRCQFDAIHLTRDIPAASDMHTAEEMMKIVGPYALKRGMKILKKKITGKSEYPTMQ